MCRPRDIPIPAHLSQPARAQMAAGSLSKPAWLALDDTGAWRRLIASMDAMGLAGLSMLGQHVKAEVTSLDVNGVRVYAVRPSSTPDDGSVYLDIHGGALLWGGGPSCRAMGVISAAMMAAHVWAVDYRMPPDHPYPVALDDCVNAYKELLRERPAHKIMIWAHRPAGTLPP
jgi:monoterpene epsilon-lactone hydrolase